MTITKSVAIFLNRRQNFILFMALGSILMLFLFTIYPFIYNVTTSFTDFFLFSKEKANFIGFQNYQTLIKDPLFWHSSMISLIYVVGAVVIEVILGFLIAYIINEERRLQNLFLIIILLPLAATPVAISFVWRIMFNADLGVLNYLLTLLHLPISKWASGYNSALFSLILVDIWQWTPFAIIIILAGLMALPLDLFEAAEVDGATRWQILKYITLPLIKSTIVVVILLRSLDAFRVFDTIYVITAGGPAHQTESLNMFTYFQGFKYFNMGYMAALAIIMLLISTVFATVVVHSTIKHSSVW